MGWLNRPSAKEGAPEPAGPRTVAGETPILSDKEAEEKQALDHKIREAMTRIEFLGDDVLIRLRRADLEETPQDEDQEPKAP